MCNYNAPYIKNGIEIHKKVIAINHFLKIALIYNIKKL